MIGKIFISFVVFGIIKNADGFSASVPPLRSVCTNMLPHHHSYKPQAGEAPYSIQLSSNSIAGGGDVFVTLNSTAKDVLFRGFYMQARNENSEPVGSFTPNDDAKVHNCFGKRHNSAHHANGKIEKPRISVVWTAPKDFTGEVFFISTFVKDFVTIYSGVYSEPLEVTPYIKKQNTLFGNSGNSGGLGDFIGLLGAVGINIPGINSKAQ